MARVLVPIAEGCEEVEAVTVIDLLRRAGIEVVAAGLVAGPVRASRGVVLVPDTELDAVAGEHFDMIVLPGGGGGAQRLEEDPRITALLRRMRDEGAYTAAICAAPRVFAAAGLLEGKRATSFPGALDSSTVAGLSYSDDPVVEDGRLVTSRGPGTAIDFALKLIELLEGQARADEVESALQRP